MFPPPPRTSAPFVRWWGHKNHKQPLCLLQGQPDTEQQRPVNLIQLTVQDEPGSIFYKLQSFAALRRTWRVSHPKGGYSGGDRLPHSAGQSISNDKSKVKALLAGWIMGRFWNSHHYPSLPVGEVHVLLSVSKVKSLGNILGGKKKS